MKDKKIGYKCFNKNLMCKDFQYKIGETFIHKGKIGLCIQGFHYCNKCVDIFNYYDFNPNNRVCEVEILGDFIDGENKSVTNKIKILEEISWSEVLEKCNTGYRNTGYRNTGDYNTGDYNTGYRNIENRNTGDYNTGDYNTGYKNAGNYNTGYYNTGNYNTGNYNTGDYNTGYYNTGYKNTGYYNTGYYNTGNWNTCNYETGHFNTKQSKKIRVFNKFIDIELFNSCEKPNFLYFNLTVWVFESDMTNLEKIKYSNYKITNGYLKELEYKEAFKLSFKKQKNKKRELDLLFKLPNFNPKIFKEISGLDFSKEYKEWKKNNK